MKNLQNTHDLTDEQWEKIAPIITTLPDKRGGSNVNDNRVFVDAFFWDYQNRFTMA